MNMIKDTLWYKRAKKEAEKEIPNSEKVSGVGFFLISIFMLLFLVAHEVWETGFYTDEFGLLERVALYGFWTMWIITAGLDSVLGMRLESRLFDSCGGIIFAALTSLLLLLVFPFDFEFFAQPLPDNIEWLLSWIGDDIGRGIVFISFIFHLVAAVISPFIYKVLIKP